MKVSDFIIRLPEDRYHEGARTGRYLSSHMLADFRKCPLLYYKKVSGAITDTATPAFVIGRAAHKLILEGRGAFDEEYLVHDGPVNEKTGEAYGKSTKVYAAWMQQQDREIIGNKDFSFLIQLQTSVWLHPVAAEWLDSGIAEGVIRAGYANEPCQIRMDFFSDEFGIIDLKTCDDLTWFESDFAHYGYAYQLAFYRAVFRQQTGITPNVHVIAVEKKEPYRCGVWQISESTLNYAEMENLAAIERLQACRESNRWPTGYEDLRIIINP